MNWRNVASVALAVVALFAAQWLFTELLSSEYGQLAFLGFVGKIIGGAAKGVAKGAKGVFKGVKAVAKPVIKTVPKAAAGFATGGPAGAIVGAGTGIAGQIIGRGGPEQFDPLENVVPINPDPRFSGRVVDYTPSSQPGVETTASGFFQQSINRIREALAKEVLSLGSAGTTALTRTVAPDGTDADRALAIPTDVRRLQGLFIVGGVAIVGAFAFLAFRKG